MEEIKRLYYTTGEAAKMLGVTYTTIHTWLKEYQIDVRKSKHGYRKLAPDQVDKLKLIHRLSKEYGMKHEGIKKYLEQNSWKHSGQYNIVAQ